MKTALLRSVVLPSLLLGLSACSDAESENTAMSTGTDAGSLEGRNWALSGFADNEGLPAEVTVTARFEQGRLSGSAGCNNYFAAYNLGEEGGLSIEMPASTRKMCRGPAMEVERRFLAALPKVQRFAVVVEGLELVYLEADSEAVLRFSE